MTEKIKIAHVNIETPLYISNEYVQLLILESPTEFYKAVNDLNGQFEGGAGAFVFSRCGEIVSAEKYGMMVCDLFHFDLNDKKVLNLLYKQLERNALEGEYMPAFYAINGKTVEFLEKLFYSVPFALTYDEPQPLEVFKAVGIKFEKVYESLEEKIICYINAMIELKKCEFFIFVNLKNVLNDEKLELLYRHCQAEKVGLLLIEHYKVRPLLACEKAVIITEDLCEILENYEEL